MPLLSTRAVASARGYGMSTGRKLFTYVFPGGTSNWTCPPNTTALVSAVGRGGSATPDSWFEYIVGLGSLSAQEFSRPNPPYLQWSEVYNNALNAINSINSYGTGERTLTAVGCIGYVITSDNRWESYNTTIVGPSGFTIRGTATYFSGSIPTSGNATYTGVQSLGFYPWHRATVDRLYPGNNGASTTGFNRSFAGGTYSGPYVYGYPDTTYNNIAVTPGQVYSITNNGALTITYYQ